jgi:hypothetical protein
MWLWSKILLLRQNLLNPNPIDHGGKNSTGPIVANILVNPIFGILETADETIQNRHEIMPTTAGTEA